MDIENKSTMHNKESFEIHGLTLSYAYIAGAKAIIVNGIDGQMLDALVLDSKENETDALQLIHFYDVAAQSHALRLTGGVSRSIERALNGVRDEARRRHVLDKIHTVVACASDLLKRDYMRFADRIARMGHFHGIEIVRRRDGAYYVSFSTNLGSQTETSVASIQALLRVLGQELDAASQIACYFKNSSYPALIDETIMALQDVDALLSLANERACLQASWTMPESFRSHAAYV